MQKAIIKKNIEILGELGHTLMDSQNMELAVQVHKL